MAEENAKYTERPTLQQLMALHTGSTDSESQKAAHGYTAVEASDDAKYIADKIIAEVSADNKYIAECIKKASGRIIMHLWIICVLLPAALGLLWEILK